MKVIDRLTKNLNLSADHTEYLKGKPEVSLGTIVLAKLKKSWKKIRREKDFSDNS